jgi:hypothetical protein
MADDQLTPAEQIARLYEQAEAAAAEASERLVGSGGFASLLGQVAENVAALTKASGDALDGAVHNLRIAGRRDVIRLERQLARTEDKLERVLQEIELLQDRLEQSNETEPAAAAKPKPVRRAKPDKPDQPDAEPRP